MDPRFDSTFFPFDSAATYRICVQGRIPEHWADRLEGMSVTEEVSGTTSPVTTLFGELSDQAALAGVLKTIYDLHLLVISVLRVDEEAKVDANNSE